MTAKPAQPRPSAPRPVTSAVEARELIGHYSDVMETLLDLIEQETELVRAGRLRDAAKLERHKSELASLYVADTARLEASKPYLAETLPQVLTALRGRHDTFRSLLQINLTVLATAHAVSEGIVRGVSDEINRNQVPQTHGAGGRTSATRPKNRQPIAVSRSA
jgi:hypothetical protein